jgi:hypothetical protein
MTDADASTLLDALGALLAAYGFFFTATTDLFTPLAIQKPAVIAQKPLQWAEDRTKLKDGRTTAHLLALAPTVIVVVFCSVFIEIVEGIDLSRPYSPLKMALAIVLLFWSGLSIAMWWRVGRIHVRIATLTKLINTPPAAGTESGRGSDSGAEPAMGSHLGPPSALG